MAGPRPHLRLGLMLGDVLGVEEEGDVGHERSHHLIHVFRDLIGLELLLVIQLCQVLLERLAEIERGAHLPRMALVGKAVQLEIPFPEESKQPPGAFEWVPFLISQPDSHMHSQLTGIQTKPANLFPLCDLHVSKWLHPQPPSSSSQKPGTHS